MTVEKQEQKWKQHFFYGSQCFTIPFHKFSSLCAVVVYIYFILLRNRNKSTQHFSKAKSFRGLRAEQGGVEECRKYFYIQQNRKCRGELLLLAHKNEKKWELRVFFIQSKPKPHKHCEAFRLRYQLSIHNSVNKNAGKSDSIQWSDVHAARFFTEKSCESLEKAECFECWGAWCCKSDDCKLFKQIKLSRRKLKRRRSIDRFNNATPREWNPEWVSIRRDGTVSSFPWVKVDL